MAVGVLMLAWSGYHARLLLVQTTAWSQGNQTLIARLATLNLSADQPPERLVARVSHINGRRVFPPVVVALRWRGGAPGSSGDSGLRCNRYTGA